MSKVVHGKVRSLCGGCKDNSYDTNKAGENYKKLNDRLGYNEFQDSYSISVRPKISYDTDKFGRNISLYATDVYHNSGNQTYADQIHYLWPNSITNFYTIHRQFLRYNIQNSSYHLHWKNIIPDFSSLDGDYNIKSSLNDFISLKCIDNVLNGTSTKSIFVPIFKEFPEGTPVYTSVEIGKTQNDVCSNVYESTTCPDLLNEYMADTNSTNIDFRIPSPNQIATMNLINSRIPCAKNWIEVGSLGIQIPWLIWLTWKKGYDLYPPPEPNINFDFLSQKFCDWNPRPRFLWYGIEAALNNPFDNRKPIYASVPEDLPPTIEYGYLFNLNNDLTLNASSWENAKKVKITTTRKTHIVKVIDNRDTKWLNGWLGIQNYNGVPDYNLANFTCDLNAYTKLPNPENLCQGPTCGVIQEIDDLWTQKINEFNDMTQITLNLDGQIYPYLGDGITSLGGGAYLTYDVKIEDTTFDGCNISPDGEILYVPDLIKDDIIIGTSGSYTIKRTPKTIKSVQLLDELTSLFTGVEEFNTVQPGTFIEHLRDWGLESIEYSALSHYKTIDSDDNFEPMEGPYQRFETSQYVQLNPANGIYQDLTLEYCGQTTKTISIRNLSYGDFFINGSGVKYNWTKETVNGWISEREYSLYCPHNQKEIDCLGRVSMYEIDEGKTCDDFIFNGGVLRHVKVGDIPKIKFFKYGNKKISLSEYQDPANKYKKDFSGTTLIDGNNSTTDAFYMQSSILENTPVIRKSPITAQEFYDTFDNLINEFTPIYHCKSCELGHDEVNNFLQFNFIYPRNNLSYDSQSEVDSLTTIQENFKAVKNVVNCKTNYPIQELRGFRIEDCWFDARHQLTCSIVDPYNNSNYYGFGIRKFIRPDTTLLEWESTNNLFNIPGDVGVEITLPIINYVFIANFKFSINEFGFAKLVIDGLVSQTLYADTDTIKNNATKGFKFSGGYWPIYAMDVRTNAPAVLNRNCTFYVFPDIISYNNVYIKNQVAVETYVSLIP